MMFADDDQDEIACLLVRLKLVFDEGKPVRIGKHTHLWDMPDEGDHIVDQELCDLLGCHTELIINTIDFETFEHPLATCYPCRWTGNLSDLYPYILATGWGVGIDEEKN